MKDINKIIGALLAMAICLPLHADKVYKWQDENGGWHYSEKPPAEATTETIKIKSSKPVDTDIDEEETPQGEEISTTQEEKKPLKKSPEVLAVEKARKAEDCERAKRNLDTLTHRTRILYDDEEKGEQRYLTEEERQEWLKKSKDQVKEFCQ
ncbi:MAG: DUF4124 domain-containing protein [Gammaproteobacteria bacterium]|nr:MAG: DUF4124 domain-containing protein [Gammaproteobacteria bacterium]